MIKGALEGRMLFLVVLCIVLAVQWEDKLRFADGAAPRASGWTVEMGLVYRYAEDLKEMREGQENYMAVGSGDWRSGTMEQHEKLMRRDRMRHAARGRGLLDSASSLYPSNETADLEVLGGLHYTLITIGTPSKTFLVALDTGSDLLWVPCNCQKCSPTDWASYGLQAQGLDFAIYNDSSSTTSKYLSCTDSLCSRTLTSTTSSCTSQSQKCNYVVNYMSTDTSTSGYIVEDLLYLNYEQSSGGNTSTPIYFGCGEVQTGDLVKGVAPNGLFGLGPESISVPSTLARNGIVPTNSFSMCFSSSDTSGRLVFGVQALEGLPSTPLVPTNPSVYYVLAMTKFSTNGESVGVSENVIFDTGTSYTTLPQSAYQQVGDLLNKQINLPQFQLNGTFDYCWNTSDTSILNSLPSLTITFAGGSTWDVLDPYVNFLTTRGDLVFFCLGITPSSNGIIGHNFMGGYEFFFNQQAMTFSWAPSSCYNLNASTVGSPEDGPTLVNRASTQSSSSVSYRASLTNASLLLISLLLASILFL